jgi:hypothetical protein
MILDATTKSLEVLLAGAVTTNQLEIVADWLDMTATTTAPGDTGSVTNNSTAVTAVAAPASSTQRKVNEITIFNADTVAAIVTVRVNDNGTMRRKLKITLQPGYTLEYTFSSGWKVLDTNGLIQTSNTAVLSVATQIVGVNDQTGTSYTIGLGDAGKDVRCNNASAFTLTIPANSTTAFPIGTFLLFSQQGAGTVTATAASGVTLRAANGASTTVLYDARGLEKTDTDTWRVW